LDNGENELNGSTLATQASKTKTGWKCVLGWFWSNICVRKKKKNLTDNATQICWGSILNLFIVKWLNTITNVLSVF
jgi:hypothetical protein